MLFTIGNIVSLSRRARSRCAARTRLWQQRLTPPPAALRSTAFLCGPKKQFRNMTDRTRLLTSIVYVVFMILTLVAALKWKSKIGTVICCLVQYGALTWYTLSYIPFARALAKKLMGSALPSMGA